MTLLDFRHAQATRRSRIYSGRIRRALFGAGLRYPCVFVHLPKCGGTSLSEALYATVPIQKRVGVIDAMSTRRAASIMAFGQDNAWRCHDDLEHGHHTFDLREQMVLTHACWGTDLVHGHVLMTDRVRTHLPGRYRFLTIMRDPIQRVISNYRMAVAAGIADPDPDVWLQSPIARAHTTTYLRYLSGQHSVHPEAEDACLERALSALDLFSLIGFLDDLDGFVQEFNTQFGAHLSLHKYNEAKGAQVCLSDAQMARLEEMCAADQAIYHRARMIKGQPHAAAS